MFNRMPMGLVLLAVAYPFGAGGTNIVLARKPPEKMFIMFYLADTCVRLKCHLTIERLENNDGVFSIFRAGYLDPNPQVKTVEELVKKLRKDLKTVTVVRSKDNPDILHLIEHGLSGEKGYALDQKATIEFSGVLADLPPALGKHVSGIGGMTVFDNTNLFDDYITKVTVRSKNQPVREILTNCVPLDGYNPVLWFASTSTKGGKPKTMVQYAGHVPPDE